MLHEKHGGTADPQELLKLHPGEDINIVQRLVPHIQVGALAQAAGKKHLLFLPGAVIFSNCTRAKSSLRRMVLNCVSSSSERRANWLRLPRRKEASWGT